MDAAPQSTVARLFDAMADEYEVLEPWYEHLYARLHAILGAHLRLPPDARGARALDAGCGIGFQAALLDGLGYETHGVDIAAALLVRAGRRVPRAVFARGDLTALPYADGSFEVVSCVGSTLSFVADPDAALRELARVLRPGGRVLLECEHKWSLDLAWMLASALAGDRLGYDVPARTIWRALRAPVHASIALPYPGYGTLTLFSGKDLRRRLVAAGLRWQRAWGIHAITNALPSTVLHRPLGRTLATIDRALRRVDATIGGTAPARALANSLVVLAVKA